MYVRSCVRLCARFAAIDALCLCHHHLHSLLFHLQASKVEIDVPGCTVVARIPRPAPPARGGTADPLLGSDDPDVVQSDEDGARQRAQKVGQSIVRAIEAMGFGVQLQDTQYVGVGAGVGGGLCASCVDGEHECVCMYVMGQLCCAPFFLYPSPLGWWRTGTRPLMCP